MNEGQVVEQGTHEELLQKEDGLYHAMWLEQQAADKSGETFSESFEDSEQQSVKVEDIEGNTAPR